MDDSSDDIRRELATAYEDWDRRWRDANERSLWEDPEPVVRDLLPELRRRDALRALDLGCGVGRHALFLAAEGFDVLGTDASPSGIVRAREVAAAAGLLVEFEVGDFLDLNVEDGSFDYVIAWNVVYHGDRGVAAAVIEKVRRALRPGGLYQATMLSKRNAAYGVGAEVAPDTFVDPSDKGDKRHPHFYCDAATLLALHDGFEVMSLADNEQRAGAWHWHLTMERHSGRS